MARGEYSIPGFFENVTIKGNKICEPGILGKTLYIIKGNKICESGFFGKTILEIKNGKICEPGFFGKTLFYLDKDGKVKEKGLFGRTVGYFPPFPEMVDREKVQEHTTENKKTTVKPVKHSSNTGKISTGQSIPYISLEDEREKIDVQGGYVADYSTSKKADLKVPLKYTKITAIPPAMEVDRVHIHENISVINSIGIHCTKEYIVDSNNKYFKSVEGVLYDKNMTTLISIPDELNDFSVLHLPESVTTLARGCSCYKDGSYFIPKSVKKIDSIGHSELSSKKEFIVEDGNETFKTIDGLLYTFDGKILLGVPHPFKWKKWVIPKEVSEIGPFAFFGSNLKHIIIPDGVRKIGRCAFDCSKITYAYIPDSVEVLEKHSFYRVTNCIIEFACKSEKNTWDKEWKNTDERYVNWNSTIYFSKNKPTKEYFES